jgi:hypothetical protein
MFKRWFAAGRRPCRAPIRRADELHTVIAKTTKIFHRHSKSRTQKASKVRQFPRFCPCVLATGGCCVAKGRRQAITDLDYCNAHASGLTSSRALARGRLPTLSIGDFCHGGWFRCRSRCVLRSKVAGPHQAITQQHAPLCVWTARTANASLAQASVPTLSRHVWDTVSSWHPSGLRERRAVASCYSRRVLC